MLKLSMSYRCSTDNQSAVCDSFSDSRKLLGSLQNRACGNSRNGLPERNLVRIDHPQGVETEILHCAGGGSDIERISGRDQNDDEVQAYCSL